MTKQELNTLIDHLTVAHRTREDFMKSRMAFANNMKAVHRNAKRRGVELDIKEGLDKFVGASEKEWGKTMGTIAKQLPIHDWFCSHVGCSTMGFASIIAETGDLSNYVNPAKVWRRMGLSVHDGVADKNRTKGENIGYSKRCRMIAYRVSSAIIKKKGEYRELYDQRKAYEIERDAEGYNVPYIEKRGKAAMMNAYTTSKKKIEAGMLPACVIDLWAQRWMVKRLIRNLWIEWVKELGVVEAI